MPFAGYKDHAHCMRENQDKDDPAAYCAEVMRRVEKGCTPIAKIDEDRRLVFGWASVAVQKDGSALVDRQGDVIEPQMLEDAAYEFVLVFREADEMHNQITKGHLVESFVSTPEKRQAMGMTGDDQSVAWWVGFRLEPDLFQKVKDGTLGMFSIEGVGRRVPV